MTTIENPSAASPLVVGWAGLDDVALQVPVVAEPVRGLYDNSELIGSDRWVKSSS